MCGICGTFNFDPRQRVERAAVERMNRQIVHRGPDDDGFYVQGNVGLAMRRLSIVDLTTGNQPMTNEDETVWLVYNGEIYNHEELRPDLQARGHRYHSRSDTETIVHLYEEYGRRCVTYLRGMFAFALWDSRRRVLLLARDRLGIKPLYYRQTPRGLEFASEIKCLLANSTSPAELNRECLPEYLAFGYLSGEETFFQGIRKLMPGHTLEVNEAGEVSIEQYWDLAPEADSVHRSEKQWVQDYRDRLEQAVSSHLMSDVPLGVFLSGGLDSSAVAALMTRIRRSPVSSFSVGYDEVPFSELPYAREVSTHLGSDHHEVIVGREEFFAALPKLIWHEDEPIVWPSSVALYFVARLAREHVKVVLTGEGSDETLAGYTRYAFTLWNSRWDRRYRSVVPQRFRAAIRGFVADSSLLGSGLRRKLEHTFLGRDGESWASFYFDNFYSAFSQPEQQGLLSDELRSLNGGPYANVMRCWESSSGPLLKRLLFTDIKTYLVELLMKQDQMSMAASVESRVPFLDHRLVEFAYGIPEEHSLRGLAGKEVLKSAIRDLLPDSIIYRKKMGFPTPWAHWISGPHFETVEKMLLEPRALARGFFRPEAVRKVLAEHRARHRDHADRIWRLLNLELWCRVFQDADPAYIPDNSVVASMRS